MNVTRRGFLGTVGAAAGGIAGLSLAQQRALGRSLRGNRRRAESGVFKWIRLERDNRAIGDDDSRLYAVLGEGGNALVVVTKSACLLVDTKNCPYGGLLKAEMAGLGIDLASIPNKLVINTHHHADHTGGNFAFSGSGMGSAPIMAHTNAVKRIEGNLQRYKDQAAAVIRTIDSASGERGEVLKMHVEPVKNKADGWKATDFAPTRELKGHHETIKLGDLEIDVIHPGPGHTDNDIFIKLPQFNVVHTGDLVFYRSHAYVDLAGGANTKAWMRSVAEVLTKCDNKTVVVPGHGEVTDVEGARQELAYLDDVRLHVGNIVLKGGTRKEAEDLVIPAYKDYGLPQIRPIAFGAVFDELSAQVKAWPSPPTLPSSAPAAPKAPPTEGPKK